MREAVDQHRAQDAFREQTGEFRCDACAHRVADHVEAIPAQIVRDGEHVLHVEQRRVVNAGGAMRRETVTGEIWRDQVEFRQQRRETVEGVGVVEPAVQRERGNARRVAPCLGR